MIIKNYLWAALALLIYGCSQPPDKTDWLENSNAAPQAATTTVQDDSLSTVGGNHGHSGHR